MPNFRKRLLMSFTNAVRGISYLFKSQKNARIELVITIFIPAGGILFKISNSEWAIILLCIALVLSFEAMNTAIEILADEVHPGIHPQIGKVKDVAAGAVLITSIVAAIIGFIIFAPKFLILFTN